MISTVLLVFSAICFISAFGIHMFGKNDPMNRCGYMDVPWMASIPWISGFLLAVIPEAMIIKIAWYWLLLLNAGLVFTIGPALTKFFLVRFAS